MRLDIEPNLSTARKVLLLIALALVVFLLAAPIKTERGLICRHTLSQHGYTEWLGLFRFDERYTQSPVEAYLEKARPESITHNWVSYNGTGKNVFGTSMVFSHGRPGELLQLSRYALPYLQTLTDKQKDDIATTLKSEDPVAIRAMIESVLNEVMKEPVPPKGQGVDLITSDYVRDARGNVIAVEPTGTVR